MSDSWSEVCGLIVDIVLVGGRSIDRPGIDRSGIDYVVYVLRRSASDLGFPLNPPVGSLKLRRAHTVVAYRGWDA